MPLDINQNNSWKGISSDSDIDIISIKSPVHIDSKPFLHNSTPNSTYVNCKLTHKRKKSKKCEPEVMISTGILPKRTKVMSMKNETQSRKVRVCIVYKNNIVYNKNLICF